MSSTGKTYSMDAGAKQGKEATRSLSELGAGLNMLKFLIGLGIISLPEATKHVGWLPCIIGLGVVAFITVWGIFFALQARQKLDKLEEECHDANTARGMTEGDPLMSNQSWQDMPSYGCGFFDKVVGKVFGKWAQFIFAASIALGQFTTLVCYVNVIATNFESYFATGPSHVTILILLGLLLGVFALTPNLQGVAYLSAAGLSIYAFLFVGVIVQFVRLLQEGSLPASAVMVRPVPESSYGQWFGVACFAFSGFPISMAIYEEMQKPHLFHMVVSATFTVAWIAYSSFAVLGFASYGQDTNVLVYFNFEEGSTWRNGSSAALALILLFSFMIQAMPIFNCTASAWGHSGLGKRFEMEGLPMHVVRWVIIALCIMCAYMVPNVKILMDTFGAISGVLSSFLFPALTYLKLSSPDEWLARARCLLVVFIGCMGAFISCTSVQAA